MDIAVARRRERVIDRSVHAVTDHGSLLNFLQRPAIPAGINSIHHNGLPIDLQFQPRGFDTTVVTFHGAVDSQARLPMLVGRGLTNDMAVNRIYLGDPTLVLDRELRLSWYAGSETHPSLQNDLDQIVKHLLKVAGSRRVIFFGSSGGGFAALRMSREFRGSLAMVVNPQTSMERHRASTVSHYLDVAWRGVTQDRLPKTVQHDLVTYYGGGAANTVAYLQNTRDAFHITQHQGPFFTTARRNCDVWSIGEAWGPLDSTDGHVPPPKDYLRSVLGSLVASETPWSQTLATLGFSPI